MKAFYLLILTSLFISGCANKTLKSNISDNRNNLVDCGSFSIYKTESRTDSVRFNINVTACFDDFEVQGSVIFVRNYKDELVGQFKTDGKGHVLITLKSGIYSLVAKGYVYSPMMSAKNLYQAGDYEIKFRLSNPSPLLH
ncbi:MAG TPA: hypothetical protein VNI52_00895 [Sphingobacteriaceae bacterium]|nr:hypothetical protein [Sphingobacteriaceae bacterium]